MPRKPNYEFERRERARLKAIKNAEKAAAKKEAKERAKAETAVLHTKRSRDVFASHDCAGRSKPSGQHLGKFA